MSASPPVTLVTLVTLLLVGYRALPPGCGAAPGPAPT